MIKTIKIQRTEKIKKSVLTVECYFVDSSEFVLILKSKVCIFYLRRQVSTKKQKILKRIELGNRMVRFVA